MKQDNPQQAIADCAYAAGYIDGEGTFQITIQTNRPSQYRPRISVTSVDMIPVEFLQRLFGGWIWKYQPPSRNNNAREAYRWDIEGYDKVLNVVINILPYLKLKKQHAEIIYRLIVESEPNSAPNPVSDQELQRRKQLKEELNTLNKRGVQLQRLSEKASE